MTHQLEFEFMAEVPRMVSPRSLLTLKQLEVMNLLCVGYTGKEIAEVLGISPSGVRDHLGAIYKKLKAKNATNAAFNYANRKMTQPCGAI